MHRHTVFRRITFNAYVLLTERKKTKLNSLIQECNQMLGDAKRITYPNILQPCHAKDGNKPTINSGRPLNPYTRIK